MAELDFKKNYFELFDLQPEFELSIRVLSDRYKDLQRRSHPDTVVSTDESRKRFAVRAAARINEAYRVLHNPLNRAAYLLELKGYSLKDEASVMLPPEFLMRQMQWREELETIPGTDNPQECLLELRERIESEIEQLYGSYTLQMRDQQYPEARATVHGLQFFHKLLNEIGELQYELEDELN